MRWCIVAAVLGVSAARAETPEWQVWAEGFTDLPTQVAAGLEVRSPQGVRLRTSLGWMPSDYVALANEVAVQFDGYSSAQGDAVVAALGNSLVWSAALGWQPWLDSGFAFDFGYQLLTLGGSATSEELLVIATGVPPGEQTRDVGAWRYDLGVTVHRLRLGLSWTWLLDAAGRVGVVARVGGEATLTSASDIEPERVGFGLDRANHFARLAETQLDDILQSYVHYPTVGLAFAYRID